MEGVQYGKHFLCRVCLNHPNRKLKVVVPTA
jgi:hypothetical protein